MTHAYTSIHVIKAANQFNSVYLLNSSTYKGEGGGCHPLSEVFLSFFLDDKKSAACIFSSCLFILRTNFETSLATVSYYGCEIRRHN